MSWVSELFSGSFNYGPVDIPRLLAELGIEADQRGSKWVACCPDPKHQDRSPSWMIRDDAGMDWHGSHNCKSCGFAGGTWELVAAVKGITVEEAGKFVRSLPQIPQVPDKEIPRVSIGLRRTRRYKLPAGVVTPQEPEDLHPAARKYLLARGVTDAQIERWSIGFATVGRLAWRIVLPVYTGNRLLTYSARSIFEDGSRRYDMPQRADGARSDSALWGEPAFELKRGVVTVAEGIFSAMALERAGAPNPCALLGSEVTPQKIALLEPYPVVLVATDPDAAGEKAFAQLRAALRRNAYIERIELPASPDDCDPAALRRAVTMATGGFATVTTRLY